jgi:putative ABC transport system permease protein
MSLGVRSLRSNLLLTILMISAIALGIGACITTLTVVHVLSGDPVPSRKGELFYVRVDPRGADGYEKGVTRPAPMMTYVDAMSIIAAHRASRSTAVALTPAKVVPAVSGVHPFFTEAVTTTNDFFAMFDARFRYGHAWSSADDASSPNVVVLSDQTNHQLFDGKNSVGRTINVNGHDLEVIGVLVNWAPEPRFYALGLSRRSFGDGDAVFIPISTSLDAGMVPENLNCFGKVDLTSLRSSPCMFLGF